MTKNHESTPQREQEEASPLAKEALFNTVTSLGKEDLLYEVWNDEYGFPISFSYNEQPSHKKVAHTTNISFGIHLDTSRARYQVSGEGEVKESDRHASGYYVVGRDQHNSIYLHRTPGRPFIEAVQQGLRNSEPIKEPVSEYDAWRLVHTIRTMKRKNT